MNKQLSSKGKKVIQYRKKFPEMRTAEIAKVVGLTRERVRQVLRDEGLSTRISPKEQRYCSQCKNPVSGSTVTCRKCIRENAWVIVPCSTCGADKEVRKSTHRYRQKEESHYSGKYYCNRQCFYNRLDPFKRETMDD